MVETLGRFALARRIGAGSTGVVYAAADAEDGGRPLAVKRLARVDGDGIFRLKSEFRALTDLVHPNLVRLYELIEHEREWLVTMELVDGEDFLSWVRPGGRLDLGRLAHALVGLGAGLEAVHAAGRVHRDLKPSNVRITEAGRVVILDFGLATGLAGSGGVTPAGGRPTGAPRAPMTPASAVAGTPAYMSPEQARGRPLTPASDAYAVGVMMYEAVAGRLPFEGSAMEQLLARMRTQPVFPAEIVVPDHVARACLGLLEPDPARRLPLADALSALGVSPSVPPPRVSFPFVGRDRELAMLEAALADARRDVVVVDVSGPSGSGKTSLVESFLTRARASGAVVLAGRCYERAHVPYKAVDAVVDALAEHVDALPPTEDGWALARVFPALAVLRGPGADIEVDDAADVRARAFAALRTLLARLASTAPLVVFIDDLQWGDVDGAALLGALVRPPDAPRVLVIAGYRAEEVGSSACINTWLASRGAVDARLLAVGPLAPDEARALARALLVADDPRVESLAHDSAGSPFLLTELARAAPSAAPIPSIGEAVRARVRALPDDARALLEALALAGSPIEQGVVARAAAVRDGPEAIARLRFEHLARTSGSGRRASVETYHDRVREAVEEGLDPDAKRALHRALGEALEAAGSTSPERLAEHFSAAGMRERAADHAVRAAAGAMQALAFDRAATSYLQALSLLGVGDPRRRALEIGLGEALAYAGRGADAAAAFSLAAESSPDREARLELVRRSAEQLLAAGHVEAGLAAIAPVLAAADLSLAQTTRGAIWSWLMSRARLWLRGLRLVEAAGRSPPSTLRADVCWTLTLGLNALDMVRSADFATRGLIAALDIGDRTRAGRALAYEAATSAFLGSRARAEEVLRVLEPLAEGDPYLEAQHHLVAGIVEAFTSGRWRAALAHYAEAERRLAMPHPSAARDRTTLAMVTTWSLFYRGELLEIRQRTPALLASARARNDLYAETALANASAWSLLIDGQAERARADLDRRAAAWTAPGFHLQHYIALLAHTHVDRYLGEGARAFARWRAASAPLAASQMLRVDNNRWVACYERGTTAVAALEQPGALALAHSEAKALARSGAAWAVPFAGLIRGGVACADRREDTARAEFERAAVGFDAADLPLYAAAARHARARLEGDGVALARARAAFAERGVAEPDRWAEMLAPTPRP